MTLLSSEQADAIITQLGYNSIADYQRAYNIPVTIEGQLDTTTARSLSAIRFCQLPELFSLDAAALNKWGKSIITWKLSSNATLPGFQLVDLVDVFKWAFSQWAVHTQLVFNSTALQADITITTGNIDSPGNTLAWSELPGPNAIHQKLTQKFDSSEPFVFSSNPPPNRIDLGAVACHEIGHALGLSHAPVSSRALLAPIYNPPVRLPQSWDITEIQRRYGPVINGPTIDPIVPVPPSVPIPPTGPSPPLSPIVPLPYDPTHPEKKIFPPGIAPPSIVGYTWICLPSAFVPLVLPSPVAANPPQ